MRPAAKNTQSRSAVLPMPGGADRATFACLMASPDLAINVFGPIVIEHEQRHLGPRDFGGSRPKQVLEILLAARGRHVPTARLAELLWSEHQPDDAAGSLQTFVSVLRRQLTTDAAVARKLVVTEPGAYRFAVEHANIDIDCFDRLLGEAGSAPTKKARRLLEQALALAVGEVLEDEPYADWAEELRASYRSRVLGANLEAADAALAVCDYPAGLTLAEAAATIDRFSERGHRTKMLALYALGRAHEALDSYQRLRALLDGELGLAPSEPTRALETAILRQEDVSGLIPRPTGPIELRTPGRPWLLFLGREPELAALERMVRSGIDGGFTIGLVEGESGLGKSRLLDELATILNGARLGRASCSALEQHLAYVPLATALRDALSDVALDATELPALTGILPELGVRCPAAARFPEVDVLEAIVHVITTHAPMVLLLDDLQYADAHTIAALGYLRRRCAQLPCAVVGAARPEEVRADHPFRLLEPDATVSLEPLTAGDLAPLAMAGLHERTGGHPEFVSEQLASEVQSGPRRAVAEVVMARCRAEGAIPSRVLLTAAALEEPFEPELVAALLAFDPVELTELLERLCDRRLLRTDGFGFRFRYAIMRDVLAASMSPARRRLLQARADAVRDGRLVALAAVRGAADDGGPAWSEMAK